MVWYIIARETDRPLYISNAVAITAKALQDLLINNLEKVKQRFSPEMAEVLLEKVN